MTAAAPLYRSEIPGLPVHRGKVRDVYDLGDKILIVATDRVSAFDVVFPDPVPGKGALLTQLSVWWFNRTRGLVPNHFLTADLNEYPKFLHEHRDQIEGRSMLVRKAVPLKGEFVVRGYLDGSAWKQYEFNKVVCGIELLAGLRRRSSFGAPLFTPTTKAEEGHDLPIEFAELALIVGREEAKKARDYSIALYTYAHNMLWDHGLVLSDTKFEFGIEENGELILIDEALTPDSSRFWIRETYTPDNDRAVSLDKQFIRDYVEEIGWDKTPPAPSLPREVLEQTADRYRRALDMITRG